MDLRTAAIIGTAILTVLLAILVIYMMTCGCDALEEFTTAPDLKLVYFYKTGCPHCESFNPVWRQLEADPAIKTVSVDARASEKYGIIGFPTIRLYRQFTPSTKFIEFEGPRALSNIYEFIEENRSKL